MAWNSRAELTPWALAVLASWILAVRASSWLEYSSVIGGDPACIK
jgi:hypothetical protein